MRGAEMIEQTGERSPVTEPNHLPAAAPVRFRHIDSLRAVAALLVVWLHFSQFLPPVAGADPWFFGFLQAVPKSLDVGRVGVIVFFAISGFVICRSFGGPREGAGKRFVIRRFCRLYPAYAVSMLGGIWLWWLTGQPLTWRLVAANATMGPMFFGQDCLIGIYWTLHIELIFYALCLGLHRTRWLERPALLAGVVIVLSAASCVLRVIDHDANPSSSTVLFPHVVVLGIAVMMWGALFRTVYDATGGFRRNVWRDRGTWLVLGTAFVLPIVLDLKVGKYLLGMRAAVPPMEVVCGLWIFTLWVAWLRVDNPFLTYLGVISYSLYLFHAVVMRTTIQVVTDHPAVRAWGVPFSLYFLLCALLTVAVSAVVYRRAERPAIALGKRWTGSDLKPAG